MKIALLADMHGNELALKAVLDHLEAQGGADAHWILGDYSALGYAPAATLDMLKTLPNAKFIRGNTDRYTVAGDRPPSTPTREDVLANPELFERALGIEANFAWTLGAITNNGWLDWMKALPVQFNETLPDGTRVLCAHARPGLDGGPGFDGMSADEIRPLLEGVDADLVIVAHTHVPYKTKVDDKLVINPGSISNHLDDDKRAKYAILHADENGYEIEFHRVAYDVEKVIATLDEINHPAKGLIKNYLRQ